MPNMFCYTMKNTHACPMSLVSGCWIPRAWSFVTINADGKSHMGFPLTPRSMTLDDLELL